MKSQYRTLFLVFFITVSVLGAFGQDPEPTVSTETRPIDKQVRRSFDFEEDGVHFSNEFDGARLNKVERNGDGQYTITILPENAPINMSPWYAFKIWSEKKKNIVLRLVYPAFARHRYDPQISRDGRKWKYLDQKFITEEEKGEGVSGPTSRPKSISMRLKVSKRSLWLSAQELHNSRLVFDWIDRIARKKSSSYEDIGRSVEGRPLRMLKFGNLASTKMILVISRQHPPEVTGYLAMQAFVEKLLDGSEISRRFRREWGVYVIPLMNPDGVDHGHWRHNAGGVDLNRDWTTFNQPEGRQVSEFIRRREAETGGKFYFGIDFHSTWNDIYYPMAPEFTGNVPNLMNEWLEKIRIELPGYEPVIQPNRRLRPAIISRNYFLDSHNMEAIVFEIGDNTPRKFIRKKGRVGAAEMVKLLLQRVE